MSRAGYIARVLVGLTLAGCFVDQGVDTPTTGTTGTTGMTGTTGTTAATDTDAPTTGSTAAPTSTGEGATAGSSTGAPEDLACDMFLQDCPAGHKCAAYSAKNGAPPQAARCVPVTGMAGPGDACTVEGPATGGLDDCASGASCWHVDADNHGVCVELCGGDADAPTCSDPTTACWFVGGGGVLGLCMSLCDPLVQDCPAGDLCLGAGENFVCIPDASGPEGQTFDPCARGDACDVGLICALPEIAAECDPRWDGCCVPFCDRSDAMATCPGMGQSCLPWYEGEPPPQYANVGYCGLMQ